MIKSFANSKTSSLFNGRCHKSFRVFRSVAERKLQQLDSAVTIDFLRSPPGNRLEKLSGNRQGQYSIRINRQYRVCFVWKEGHAYEVEIVDYH